MSKLLLKFLPHSLLLVLLTCYLSFLGATSALSMGLDFGGGGTGTTSTCTPDDPLVLYPGPIGSPIRIAAFTNQTYLVADFSRKKLFWYEQSGALSPFIGTLGKPLSVAADLKINPNGKIKEAYYFIGNDTARTIDIYFDKSTSGAFSLVGQFPIGENGIQALDMEFSAEQEQLFVVDGVGREVKVVDRNGQLIRSFGAGVLADPIGIAVDSTAGFIYVSDAGDPTGYPVVPASIKVFDMLGGHLSERLISGDGLFSRPQGLALTADKIYLADSVSSQVLEFDRVTGAKTSSFGCKGSSEGHLMLPMDVVLAEAGQKLYIADNRNMRITVLPLDNSGGTP